jgi:hypothetical protein
MGVLSFENQVVNHKQASKGLSQILSPKKKRGKRQSPMLL